jgi:hypothetical protein
LAWFEFESDRFDHSSELPADANAGNRFYGRDVAEFIADGLAAHGFRTRFVDEDWGWWVEARAANGPSLEIGVYHNIDEDVDQPDLWALHLEERGRWRRKREPDASSREPLESIFRDAGIDLQPAAREH